MALKKLERRMPPAPSAPRRAKPAPKFGVPRRRRGGVLLQDVPYPVFERVSAPEPSVATEEEQDIVWGKPEALVEAVHAAPAGLFIVERRSRTWSPVYLGMSSRGVGVALRWIVQAPTILSTAIDWQQFRVRIGRATFDTTDPAGRARLRKLRDEKAEILRSGSSPKLLVGPGH